jgi:hypothetical protein
MSKWLQELEVALAGRKYGHYGLGHGRYGAVADIKPTNSTVNSFLFLLVVALGIALPITYLYKSGDLQKYFGEAEYSVPLTPQAQVPGDPLLKQVKINRDMIEVLAIALNNNTYSVKNGCSADDYVYINADWTLDRWPKHINIDDENGRRFVGNHVHETGN